VSPQRKIQARDLATDIRDGLTPSQLMAKYGLSYKGLKRAFDMLITTGLLEKAGPAGNDPRRCDQVVLRRIRRFPRYQLLDTHLPVYRGNDRGISGTLHDVSEEGVGISGIAMSPGEWTSLVINTGHAYGIGSIVLHAECRWTRPPEAEQPCLTGFEIIVISEDDQGNLMRLIEMIQSRTPHR
jgi:hypothetical protein